MSVPTTTRPDNKLAYTPREVMKILNLSRNTVYRLLRAGRISSTRFGQQFRIAPDALRGFIAEDK